MCFGIFGQIELINGNYLILVTEAESVGQIIKAPVYRVKKLKFVLISAQPGAQTSPEDQRFIEMINKLTDERSFFFAYHMDITTAVQWQLRDSAVFTAQDGDKQVKGQFPNAVGFQSRFTFNNHLLNSYTAI